MTICIHSSLVGGNLHLCVGGDTFKWVKSVPEDAWLCGESDYHTRSIEVLSRAVGENLSTLPSESHRVMWETLRQDGCSGVPWKWALKEAKFRAYLKQLVDNSKQLLETYNDSYYTNEFITIRQFLQGLTRCSIDTAAVRKILSNPDQRDGALRSFTHNLEGLLSQPVYSQTASCSGRLTIVSGPSILTLRKDRRSLLRSSHENGSLVQVDFVSLEPRVALSLSGSSTVDDVYEIIKRDVLGSTVSRADAKIATIASLYGMSARKLSEMIGEEDISIARDALKKIREYFKIPSLEKSLFRDHSDSGLIKNHYGRIMKTEDISRHVLVNRFIQSTAADGALLAFSSLFRELEKNKIKALPVFTIHDAVIFDVEEESVDLFLEHVSNPLSLPGIPGLFPVTSEIIS